MRMLIPLLSLTAAVAVAPLRAQQHMEIGGLALMSAYRGTGVTSARSTGSIGLSPGLSAGGFIGQTISERLGGELRYLASFNELKLSSGGTSTKFSSRSHIVGYDLLVYPTRRGGRLRPFVAAGGGLKVFEGTGTEQAFQPLSNLALLTRTRETLPTVDFGGGVKFHLSGNKVLRIEFRDYITKVPRVFEASPGARLGRVLHHWVPAIGFSWTF